MASASEFDSNFEASRITPTRRIPTTTSTKTTSGSKSGGCDSRVDSGSVDLETPLELSPKSPLEVLDETLTSVMRSTNSTTASPIPPPRTRYVYFINYYTVWNCHVIMII